MTKLEQAYHYIEELEISEFFIFLKSNPDVVPNPMLTRLEKAFIQSKTDVDFYDQLKALANILLSESNTQQPQQETKTETKRVINSKNYFEKLDNNGTINFD
ncbi:hypothetical protein ACE193_23675 [Bernardetia sp. OM2101]|uniref:hypothetical protein n=1 Tax=Bernardetia sp. OM2101 TaxID=3344876 RepID=UPI0035D0C30B